MTFDLSKSIEQLERTPEILAVWLSGIDEDWLHSNEGSDTWSPHTVIGHLIHGEKTDWMARANIILYHTGEKQFKPFDRFAQFENSIGKSTTELLEEFKLLRAKNLVELKKMNLNESKLDMTGIHPEFGTVTLRELLSTWVVHDLNHIGQIARTMAFQYKSEAGPWKAYLRIIKD